MMSATIRELLDYVGKMARDRLLGAVIRSQRFVPSRRFLLTRVDSYDLNEFSVGGTAETIKLHIAF